MATLDEVAARWIAEADEFESRYSRPLHPALRAKVSQLRAAAAVVKAATR